MSTFAVIDGVTRTLANLIQTELGVAVDSQNSPAASISDTNPLIHVYLYRIEVNPFFRNQPFVTPSPGVVQDPPMGLNLLYLITPYGPDQSQIQLMLGQVIQLFHESPIIPTAALHASVADTTEAVRVLPRPLSMQEMTEFWRAFEQRSYRLSATYEVSLALIDSDVSRTVSRVEERRIEVRPAS